MVTPTCNKCRKTIPAEDINVAQDVAFCRWCNVSHRLSDLTHEAHEAVVVDVNQPPPGAWSRQDGAGRSLGATHRSLASAAGLLFFCLFWNGIVSVFVLLALASTLMHLGVEMPAWFPAPDMNRSKMPLGMTIFLWLFLTPFIVIGVGMFFAFLSSLAGRTEIRLRGAEGVIYTGIGPFKWPRRFAPAEVKRVRVSDDSQVDSRGRRRESKSITLEMADGKSIKFGSGLTNERRAFLAAALRDALGNRF